MSAIVLSLRWPATSLNQALELPIHTPPPKGKYRSPEQQAASERARHRWGQVKMLHVEFYRARRYDQCGQIVCCVCTGSVAASVFMCHLCETVMYVSAL